MLTPYYTTRLKCVDCGTFEMGTRDRPDPAAKCPWCDGDLETVSQCKGMTSRALPFTSDPRQDEVISTTGISQVNQYRNRKNRKSTGRPKGGNGRSTHRWESDKRNDEANRERYEKRKLPKADSGSGPKS